MNPGASSSDDHAVIFGGPIVVMVRTRSGCLVAANSWEVSGLCPTIRDGVQTLFESGPQVWYLSGQVDFGTVCPDTGTLIEGVDFHAPVAAALRGGNARLPFVEVAGEITRALVQAASDLWRSRPWSNDFPSDELTRIGVVRSREALLLGVWYQWDTKAFSTKATITSPIPRVSVNGDQVVHDTIHAGLAPVGAPAADPVYRRVVEGKDDPDVEEAMAFASLLITANAQRDEARRGRWKTPVRSPMQAAHVEEDRVVWLARADSDPYLRDISA